MESLISAYYLGMQEERSLGDDAHLLTIVDLFGTISPSYEALGRLLEEKYDDDFTYERDEGSLNDP